MSGVDHNVLNLMDKMTYDSSSGLHPFLNSTIPKKEQCDVYIARCYLLNNSPMGTFLHQLEEFVNDGCINEKLLTNTFQTFISILKSHKLLVQVKNYISYLDEDNKAKPHTNMVISTLAAYYLQLLSYRNQKSRIEPVGALFQGPAGSGKTHLTMLISEFLTGITLPDNSKTTSPFVMNSVANGKQFYWDSYKGESTVVFDDIGQAGVHDFNEIPTLISSVPKKLACAMPEKIGNVSFTSKFFLASSNTSVIQNLKNSKTLDTSAIFRRFLWFDTSNLKFVKGIYNGFIRMSFYDLKTRKFRRACRILFNNSNGTSEVIAIAQILCNDLATHYKNAVQMSNLITSLKPAKATLDAIFTACKEECQTLPKPRSKVVFEAQMMNNMPIKGNAIPRLNQPFSQPVVKPVANQFGCDWGVLNIMSVYNNSPPSNSNVNSNITSGHTQPLNSTSQPAQSQSVSFDTLSGYST